MSESSVITRTHARAPKRYRFNLTPKEVQSPDLPVDLSLVREASLHVKGPNGAPEATWTVEIDNQTSTTLRLTHLFAVGDLPVPGPYSVFATLVFDNGELDSDPRELVVQDRFDVRRRS